MKYDTTHFLEGLSVAFGGSAVRPQQRWTKNPRATLRGANEVKRTTRKQGEVKALSSLTRSFAAALISQWEAEMALEKKQRKSFQISELQRVLSAVLLLHEVTEPTKPAPGYHLVGISHADSVVRAQ